MTKNTKGLLGLMFLLLMFSACRSHNPFTEESFEETTYSIDHFTYQEDKIDVGTVYHVHISNSDRSYVKQISLYIADTNRIEAFKIYPRSHSTYLVVAEIDWNLFSIKHIQQIEIANDLSRNNTIEMHLLENPGNTYLMNNEQEIPTGHFPVSNHGYDFSDLNFVFRHLTNPTSSIEVGVLAPLQDKMVYTGKMLMTYVGEEMYNNHACYKYSLRGRGISEKEGFALVNKDAGYFEYMELDANYHAHMDYFRYELLSVTTMSQQKWEAFVIEASEDYFSTNP